MAAAALMFSLMQQPLHIKAYVFLLPKYIIIWLGISFAESLPSRWISRSYVIS